MREAGIEPVKVSVAETEDERIFAVAVPEGDMQAAMQLAAQFEQKLSTQFFQAVVSFRAVATAPVLPTGPLRSLDDPRVDALVQLLTSRSSTSEAHPSLAYIPNNRANLAAATSTRHQLVFGRRGAGKTALLLEARRLIREQHFTTAWLNMKPLRNEGPERTFLYVTRILFDSIATDLSGRGLSNVQFHERLQETRSRIRVLLEKAALKAGEVGRLVPEMQENIRLITTILGGRVYLFLDDFYHVPTIHQPEVLDFLHSITRDADVWLKVASMRHLTKWYRPSPPIGLQTGQDVDIIDLDLSLQDPAAAASFLQKMLTEYCTTVHISTTASVITREGLDRLVFASGGVPRDFLTLAASAIQTDRGRHAARAVGISAINQAAGEAARAKTGELDDALASNAGYSAQAAQALTRVRDFCLDERGFTYFRIDFRDKEKNPDEYGILTRLLDVRLVHLIDPSVSDNHRAGERSECYTLDLSQYSGYRLKQGIRVLDISDGKLVSKQTRLSRSNAENRGKKLVIGTTAREVVTILRAAPLFELALLRDLVSEYEPGVDLVENALRGRDSMAMNELVVELNRPYSEIVSVISDMIVNGTVEEVDAEGSIVYRLAR
ncbi:hypothetical protein GCM10023321_58720 [Pseudonocardia eucalypti]|uniref:Orc1-like AAA ATPase domain-containing protein n=1 Tax=Pseudonocardia eucalypti TaxID=648755 RepID=A0ABP9QSX4_9PSEU